MSYKNVEIKARCPDPAAIRKVLRAHQADFKGVDTQVDTYFRVPHGRLKHRRGNLENALIYYYRPDRPGPKLSEVTLCPLSPGNPLCDVLAQALEVAVTVTKRREIYFIDNIKFHLDQVDRLGSFVEIEAIDRTGDLTQQILEHQCQRFLDLFEIAPSDLIEGSYSDMLLDNNSP